MLFDDRAEHHPADAGHAAHGTPRRASPTLPSTWLIDATRTRWMYAATGLAVLAAIATVSFTVATVFRLHVVLPVWDEWAWVADLDRIWHGTYDWTELVRPHNEHRIAFPRLIFLADARLFAMSGRSVLATTFLLQAINAALLIRLLTESVAGTTIRIALASLVVLVLFSLRQGDNLDNVFQVQFVGVFTAALLATMAYVEALTRQAAGDRGANLYFLIAAFCCVISSYTMANGLLAGLVLVLLAVVLRGPWRTLVATVTLWCVLAAVFLHHYPPFGVAQPPSYALRHALAYVAYFCAYLGYPVSTTLAPAEAFGCLGLVLFAGAAWCVATRRTPAPAAAALLGIAGFIVATACSTTYGRAPLGTTQALEGRYVTPSSLFWCALVIFWAPAASRKALQRGRPMGRALLALVVATLAVSSTWFEVTSRPQMAAKVADFRQFRDSLLAGLYDPGVTARYEIWPDAEVRQWSDFLRDARLSLFAEPRAAFLGRRLLDFGAVTVSRSCSGGIATATADPDLGRDGTRLRGSAYDEEHGRRVRDIVVTNHDGIVVGYGSLDQPLGPPREWIGYARSTSGADVEAYAEIGERLFCPLGGATVASR